MRRHSRRTKLIHSLAVAGIIAQPFIAHASNWTGADAAWSSNANPGWNGTGVPNAVGSIANHAVNTNTTTTQDIPAGVTVGTISLTNNSNNSWTFTNTNGITLNQDGAGVGFATISNTNTSTGTTNGLVINSGTITLADNLLVSNTGNSGNTTGAIQIASVIAGTGNITFSNTSNLLTSNLIRLTGANTFTGNVLVQKGATTFNLATSFGGVATNVITLGESGMGSATLVSTAAVNVPNNIVVASGSGGTLVLGSSSASTPTYSGTVALNDNLNITSASTGTNFLTFSGNISGTGGLTKVGTGNARLTGTNSYSGGTVVNAGGLRFDSMGAIAGAGANVTVNNGGTAASLFAIDSAFLGRIVTTSTGVIALGATSSNNLDFSPFATASLGAIGSFTYTGTLTPNGTTYRLGGGGGTLTLSGANSITGNKDLVVGTNGTAATSVVVLGANNNFTGTTSVTGGILSIADINNVGIASPIGGPVLALSAITLSGGGVLRYSGATNDSTDRVFNVGTGGGGIDVSNAAATLTVPTISSTNLFTKSGSGTLAFPTILNTTSLAAAGGILTLNGTGSDNTISGALSHSGTSTINIPTGETLAVGSFASTMNTNGTLTFTGGGTFKMNAPTQDFAVGNRNVGGDVTSTVNASALSTFDVSALNFRLGQATASLTDEVVGVLTLPTASGSVSKITTAATGTLSVGYASDSGASPPNSTLNLGGGTNTIVTNSFTIGASKMGGIVQFPAASAGSLTLNGLAGGSVAITMGDNSAAGTGTDPVALLDLTTTGSVSGAIGTLTHGAVNSSGNGTSTNTFTLAAAGGGTVSINTVTFGTLSGTTPASTLTVNVGGTSTLQFNAAGNGFQLGTMGATHTRNTTINVTGGTLAMAGKDIYSATPVGTVNSTLSLTSGTLSNAGTIGNLTNFTFSGGTFLNSSVAAQTINRAVAQTSTTANSLLQVNALQATTIGGTYTVDGGANTATVLVNGTLNATSITVGGTSTAMLMGAGTLGSSTTIGAFGTVAPGNSIGTLAFGSGFTIDGTYLLETAAGSQADLLNVTGALTLNSLTSVLDLHALSTLVSSETYVIANYTSLGGTFFNVDPAITATHSVDYLTGNQIRLVPSVIPEPGTWALAALSAMGLLALRRRRVA